jgi:Type II secretory pathway, prepilin signal peptidase PulO and related peptidases
MSGKHSVWKIPSAFLTGAGLAALCTLRFGAGLRTALLSALLCVLLAAALEDLTYRRIPDCLVLAVIVISFLSAPLFPQTGWGERIPGIFVISLPLLALSLLVPGAFGGGDIKLTAASGLFLGWRLNLQSFALAMSAAGLCAVFMLVSGKAGRRSGIALAPFLCLGMSAAIFLWYE